MRLSQWKRVRAFFFHAPSDGQRSNHWLPITMCVLVAVLIAGYFAATTARTDLSLGPHQAHYAMTTTDEVVVDLGPLGTVELDSPLPFTLGLDVQVEEIPEDVRGLGHIDTFEALSGDLSAYMQFFSGPQATISDVGWALARDAGQRFVAALLVIGLIGWGSYLLLGPARRRELTLIARPYMPVAAGGLVLVLLVSAVATSGMNRKAPDSGRTATAVFKDTPLEGARITGRLAGVIDTYGGMLVEAYDDNDAFYASAAENLSTSWQERETLTQSEHERISPLLAQRRNPLLSEPQEDPGLTPEAVLQRDTELVTVLMVSDLHCNIGMAPVIKQAAELSGADVIINGGDTTMNGSTVEKFCVTSFAEAAPADVPFVSVTGNHDSSTTAQDMKDSGMIVLDGSVQEVAGIRMLGDADPNETRLGVGTQAAGTETAQETADRLADLACEESDPVDVLLVHTPWVGNPAMDSGCVNVQLSGHKHRRIGPEHIGRGVRYVNSTTAGAVEGELTIGPLRGTAEMTVLRFDTDEHVLLDYQLITVDPAAATEVGAQLRFPRPLPAVIQQ